MIRLILNDSHLQGALEEALASCRHRLFIATADVKDLHLPGEFALTDGRRRARGWSIISAFRELSDRGVEVRLLHSGIPTRPLLEELKRGIPGGLVMRRCIRVHAKAIIVDGRSMYLGSANLTGAGLGPRAHAAATSRPASGPTTSP